MFIKYERKMANGKRRVYAYVVEGYRQGGKVKHKRIMSLGLIKNKQDVSRNENILESLKKEECMIPFGSVEVVSSEEFGNIYAIEAIWKQLCLNQVFESITKRFPFERTIFSLVANRLSEPGSENMAYEWINRDAYIEGKGDIKKQHLYRALDLIIENKEKIEKLIFEELKRREIITLDKVFYDITSSYFEGGTCILAQYGYSRDKKRGKKQLLLGIILADGLPIAHFVFPGNVADKNTLKGTVNYLKNGLGIRRIMFVADRGMISEENIDFLDKLGYEYIISTKRRVGKDIRTMMLSKLEERDRIEKNFYAKEVMKKSEFRFILCMNKERAEEDRKEIDSKIEELKEKYKKYYGKKLNEKQVIALKTKLRVYARLFKLKKNLFKLDEKVYQYEKEIAGRYLLATTSNLSPSEAAKAYKQLIIVERSFREIKSFIKLRPFYHSKERRIRAHVLVSVLAFLIEAMIQKRLTMSSGKGLLELKRIRLSTLRYKDIVVKRVNTLKKEQIKVLKDLGIEISRTVV